MLLSKRLPLNIDKLWHSKQLSQSTLVSLSQLVNFEDFVGRPIIFIDVLDCTDGNNLCHHQYLSTLRECIVLLREFSIWKLEVWVKIDAVGGGDWLGSVDLATFAGENILDNSCIENNT